MRMILGICCLMMSLTVNALSVTSGQFKEGEFIPRLYTCEGENISPDLQWTGVFKETKSMVLLVSDPDAPGQVWYHWGIYNLPPNLTGLDVNESRLPESARVVANSWNRQRYDGPCPPSGTTHTYIFELFLLDKKLSETKTMDIQEVLHELTGAVIGRATLIGRYHRS